MMKKLYFAVALFLYAMANSQHVGVGTSTFSPSEVFKVVSNNKGVLLPNVNLAGYNSSLPIVNPANSLMIYNTNVNMGKGFYFWKGGKWSAIIDSSNIYKLLGITRSESVVSNAPITDSSFNGANSYTMGEIPSAHDWQMIPGLTKTFNVFSANNSVTVASSGVVQVNSTGDSLTYISYAIGIFVDGKLAGVKNFIIYGTANCLFNDYNVFFTLNNLTSGNHTIAVYETSRVNFGNSSEFITYGSKVSSCTNINNSMDKSLLNIQIAEK
jgi:hypothetical protein